MGELAAWGCWKRGRGGGSYRYLLMALAETPTLIGRVGVSLPEKKPPEIPNGHVMVPATDFP